uniref:SAM-dependent chlorinase/fluorinase n=1 Tax=Desulfovibrio sp. U5L TaxID=596152 RepID=I2PYE0_9BACT
MRQAPLIALLTDFGLADPYVGQMKSVLLSAAPGVALLDISHEVAPQNLTQAAFFLAATVPWLPPGAVTAAVVDPGVGTDRRVVLAEVGGGWVLAPDNGLLTLVCGSGCRLFDATPRAVPASATFHGRDVFAPIAARLAMGEEAGAVGTVWTGADPVRLEGLWPRRKGDTVEGRVLSVDRFGNAVVNLDIGGYGRLPATPALVAPRAVPLTPAKTYGELEQGAVGLLAGSQGYLELAVAGGSAAAKLGLKAGDAVTFFWSGEA